MPHPSAPQRPKAARVHRGLTPSHWTTLQAAVCGCFPSAELRHLTEWLESVERVGVEREPVLFQVLVCGVQFQVFRADPETVIDELREWLVSAPRSMRPELANVLIKALAEGVERAVGGQWKAGPLERPTVLSHRPPETRGAWVAATVAEELFRRLGVKADDRERLSLQLLQLLLGRAVAPREYDWRWRNSTGPGVRELVPWLSAEYERLVEVDAQRSADTPPTVGSQRAVKEWRARHRPLLRVFAVDGFEVGAKQVASRVPSSLWDSVTPATAAPNKSSRKGS